MGVKNLWRLLLPVGKRISIETLSHQTLAIDASIWLTQISKACRDPETGRLLPNRPHVRIFLLRLMRLLYHRIKPVVVFDGIMPEVKRRELQRRRDRREKLWRGTGENGADADAALKRTAKKILVKRLKEWRENNAEGGKNKKRSAVKKSSSKNGAATAFAAGFTTGEEDADAKIQSAKSDDVEQHDTNVDASEKKDKSNDTDVISIKSSSSNNDEAQQSKSEALNDENNMNIADDNAYESENDWEMAAAIQSSIDDSIKEQQKQQQQIIQHQDLSQQPVEAIASLPSEARSQWMESQYKAQRIQSRRECIGAAANPENYSSTQLRNFLKGSKLNKKMGEIGKLVGKLGEIDTDDNGFVSVLETRGSASGHRRVLKRPNNKNDDDSDDDLLNHEQSTMKALFGDDSDESDEDNGVEEEGGGFLLQNNDVKMKQANQELSATTAANDEIFIDDSSADGDSVEQETNGAAALSNHNLSHTHSNERIVNEASNTLPSESVRNRLMAFTAADEEWANWGEDDTQNNQSTEQPTKSDVTKTVDADVLASDSDGDDEPTFLPLHQKLNSRSSFTNSATKSITSSCNPTSKTQDALEDEEDNDIEWEDGSDVDDDDNDGRKEETVLLSESDLQCQQEESEEDNGENIDWQEGGDDEGVPNEELKIADQSLKFAPMKDDDNDDVVILSERTHETNGPKIVGDHDKSVKENAIENDETMNNTSAKASTNREKEVIDLDKAQPEVYSSDSSSNSFNMSDLNSDDPTTAALRHAQQTASRLTDWAGRAVQRAIAAHIEEKGGPSPEHRSFEEKNEIVDLTANDEDDNASNLKDTVSKLKSAKNTEHANTATNAATETMDFFDTSLEGLNKVHDDIIEEEKLMERDMSTITDEMKMDILSLLQLCGIPWVESPSEAEAQCAELEKLGLVDGIVTEDSDVFVFGGRKVYKNFFNEQKYVEAYFSKDIRKDLALGRSQLVALAMLLGGDYTDGVKGVGIVNGMEILQSFAIEDGKDGIRNGLQRFREWLDGIDDPLIDDTESASFLSKERIFHKKHQSARTRWMAPADFPSPAIIDGYMKPAVDNSAVNFTWGTPDIEGLRQFCANSIGWDNEETDRVVKPVLKILESVSTQTRIESYFMKYDDNITFAKVKSKRLKAVLDDIQIGADEEGSNKKQRLDDVIGEF